MRIRGFLIVAGMLVAAGAWAQEAPPSAPAGAAAEGYVWAGACKDCHADIHDSWSKTKHAKTINRLSADERKAGSACVGCHVTGPKEPVDAGGDMVNANVQCESCHGAGKAHVEAAKAGNAAAAKMVKSPPQKQCETCHNDKSPHYRGFFFSALKGLVHKQ